ncbi:unnamed protein product, partial [Effrenium voratum]
SAQFGHGHAAHGGGDPARGHGGAICSVTAHQRGGCDGRGHGPGGGRFWRHPGRGWERALRPREPWVEGEILE